MHLCGLGHCILIWTRLLTRIWGRSLFYAIRSSPSKSSFIAPRLATLLDLCSWLPLRHRSRLCASEVIALRALVIEVDQK